MGFEDELNEIIRNCPPDRQTLLFSATLTGGVEELARLSLHEPVKVTVDEAYNLNTTLLQEFARIGAHSDKNPRYREACLLALCSRHVGKGALIFVTHKSQARRLRMVLGLSGLRVGELHGNLTQPQRVDALQSFRDGDIDYLIATYLARSF
jgi:ATP-dependent RNA helicase DDX27